MQSMLIVDGLAMASVAAGVGAFALAESAFGANSDLHALYWCAVGAVLLRAAVRLCGVPR